MTLFSFFFWHISSALRRWICVFDTNFKLRLTVQLNLVFKTIPLPVEDIKLGEIGALCFLRLSRWTYQLYVRKENTKNLHGENFIGYPTLYFKLLRIERREAINFARHGLIYLVAFLKSVVILLLVGSCGNAVEYTSMNILAWIFAF